MKAAVFSGSRGIRVVDVKTPEIASSNEVLIKTRAIGICGTDLHFYARTSNLFNRIKATISSSKATIGHEFSGLVVDKGNNVGGIDLNDRVTAWPIIPCHECKYCKMELSNLCENPRTWPGAFSEYVKVTSENAVKIPNKISYEEAAMLEPLACAIHATKRAKLEKHHSCTIFGAGTIGLLILQLAKAVGIQKILAIDLFDYNLEVAQKLGADIVINTAHQSNLREENWPMKDTDIVFECVGGSASTLNQALKLVGKGGRIILIGSFTSPSKIDLLKFRQKELTIVGSEASEKRDFLEGIDLLVNGKVKVEPLITHKFPLQNIKKAFEVALNKQNKSIKVQITP